MSYLFKMDLRFVEIRALASLKETSGPLVKTIERAKKLLEQYRWYIEAFRNIFAVASMLSIVAANNDWLIGLEVQTLHVYRNNGTNNFKKYTIPDIQLEHRAFLEDEYVYFMSHRNILIFDMMTKVLDTYSFEEFGIADVKNVYFNAEKIFIICTDEKVFLIDVFWRKLTETNIREYDGMHSPETYNYVFDSSKDTFESALRRLYRC